MIKSMTAYGKAEFQSEKEYLIAEIKSLNSRFRDVIIRMPKRYQVFEKNIKAEISKKINRGRIEVHINAEENGLPAPCSVELNMPLVKSYAKAYKQLADQLGIEPQIRLDSFFSMKDIISLRPEKEDQENIQNDLEKLLRQAISSLDIMRLNEGSAIKKDLSHRLGLLEKYTIEINELVPIIVEDYSLRLKKNIQRIIPDNTVDETRIAQEIAVFAEKSDITEELVRIRSHITQFRAYLDMDKPLGRRLEFLLQEINREVNTISSKANNASISKIAVEIKAELEKLREQVQNVE